MMYPNESKEQKRKKIRNLSKREETQKRKTL
jgi:hypothetical protein